MDDPHVIAAGLTRRQADAYLEEAAREIRDQWGPRPALPRAQRPGRTVRPTPATNFRRQMAACLLRETTLEEGEIAARAGYRSVASVRALRRRMGIVRPR